MSQFPGQFGVEQPRRGGGWGWIVLILLLVGGGLAVVCCGVGAFAIRSGIGVLKAPVETALAALNDDPLITEKLGSPITTDSSFGVTNYQNNNGNGGAEVRFHASGPDGSAEVTGHMKLIAGQWSVDNLLVTRGDGSKYISNGDDFIVVQETPQP